MNFQRLKHLTRGLLVGAGLLAAQSAFAQTASCKYLIANSWGGGATASIEITNTGSAPINSWTVGWQYATNKMTSSWNATVTGNNPYSATNLSWNGAISVGQKVTFGVQVDANGGAIETPTITGAICGGTPSSSSVATSTSSKTSTSVATSVATSSKTSAPSSIATSTSSVRTSSSSSSAACSGAQQCNWYGTLYPACTSTTSGWGYENGQSCISPSTCTSQPSPYGLVGGSCSVSSSSKTSTSTSTSSKTSTSSSSSIVATSTSSSRTSSSSSSTATSLTSVQLTKLMGAGWNLGNSLDAIGGETAWGNPMVSQQLINSVKAAGFKTIRLPVAWSQFSDETNFVIKTAWMDRVEQVVNYALNNDMYVVMNIHWDGGWMQPTYARQAYVNNRLKIMWTQIATRFKNYDDRLIFAGTNEVMVDGDYGTPTVEYYTVQNSFNQTFVDAVRATGGKNATRFLTVQGFNTNIDHAVNFAKIPTDSVANKLLMEVHYYDPYNFTLNTSSNITQWGNIATNPSATETWANESYVDAQFQKMKSTFVDKGVGVILGEYGVVSRTNVSGHETYRVYWNQYITKSAVQHGMVPVYWDNGYSGNGGMAIFDRNSGVQLYPNIIQAIVGAF
jgi:endoglucanase